MSECKHKPLETYGYVADSTEAERRYKRGMHQRQCRQCKKWFWRDEFGKGWATAMRDNQEQVES